MLRLMSLADSGLWCLSLSQGPGLDGSILCSWAPISFSTAVALMNLSVTRYPVAHSRALAYLQGP